MSNLGLGRAIKQYLKDTGITQVFVSQTANIEKKKLNALLNENRKMGAEDYLAICAALDVDAYFFTGQKVKATQKCYFEERLNRRFQEQLDKMQILNRARSSEELAEIAEREFGIKITY